MRLKAVFSCDGANIEVGYEAEEAPVVLPLTTSQFERIVAGEESLAQSFMRGDVKPAGATGPLLAAVDLFEDAEFRGRLATLLSS